MLQLTIPISPEGWDEKKQEFVESKTVTIQLEHSLVSLSKWESKWCKPFLSTKMSYEETLDYIKFMTLTQNVKPEVYEHLTAENIEQINKYIEAPMTATTFSKEGGNGPSSRRIITAELVYCWMFTLGIPVEFQKWHLNRLLTLIRVCEIEGQPPKKLSTRETASKWASLNAARRKQYNTKG